MIHHEEFIALDTETTGLYFANGDRLIEIGCVEVDGLYETGRQFHTYINPYPRQVDPDAFAVHGISNKFLMDKPKFRNIYRDFLAYIGDKPLVIHNSSFDLGFINGELVNAGQPPLKNKIINTLEIARAKFPGSKVSLDALCSRFGIDSSDRTLHGALIDSVLLAQVYIKLTERDKLDLKVSSEEVDDINIDIQGFGRQFRPSRGNINPTVEEFAAHKTFVEKSLKNSLWLS